jgi:hypothetical protein
MPGVVVTTAVRTGPNGANVAPSSTFFVCGTAQRGPTDEAKLITSVSDFEEVYGTYVSSNTLHQHVRTFFEEGGTRCYVSRVVGASATAGNLSLGSADMTLTAANAGSWSSNLSATVTAVNSNFVLKIFYNGSLVYSTGEVASVQAATDKINNNSIAMNYVTATATNGNVVLSTAGEASFSAGADGSVPSSSQLISGLDLFLTPLGAGAVAIPGLYGQTYYEALIDHAKANNRIAILGMDPAITTAVAASAEASDYGSYDGAEYAAFYFPRVKVPINGVSTTISPESYVAAKRAIAHQQVGAWQAGAGVISAAKYVTGIEIPIDKADGDTLDDGRVNALRVIQGSVRIYGARSASNDEDNYRYITYRDTINAIVVDAERSLEDLVFSVIDGRRTVFSRVEARLIGILDPIRRKGGLYEAFDADGKQLDAGYTVEVTDALNPVTQLATGLIKAKVGVRVSSVGDRIEVEIIKSNLTSSVV